MRRWLLLPLLLCCLTISLLAQPPRKVYPEVGSDIPGPFKPYNVTDPRMKGFAQRYHCLVSEHGLNPTAALFIRTTELSEPLRKLLLYVDMLVDKNPRTLLAGFAVFVDDKITNPVTEDDKREAQELKIKDIQQATKVRHLALALDSAKNLEKYKLDETAAVTLLLYKEYRVVGIYKLKADEITDENVEKLIGEIRKKFLPEN